MLLAWDVVEIATSCTDAVSRREGSRRVHVCGTSAARIERVGRGSTTRSKGLFLILRTISMLSLCVGMSAALPSCASSSGRNDSGRSTRLRAGDIELAVAEVKQDLAESAFITSRDKASTKVRLVPSEMENLSSDRMSRIDRWSAVSRVLFDPSMQQLLATKNVDLFMPRDAALLLTRFGTVSDRDARVAPISIDESPDFSPTHTFAGKILSITRAASQDANAPADQRQEVVRVEYSIIELASRKVEWSGAHEFKRTASGLLID